MAIKARGATFHAAVVRFRPIMMTTTAALHGALPLAFSFGVGSELRQPLSVSIVGGLLVSQGAHALHNAGGLSDAGSTATGRAAPARSFGSLPASAPGSG